MIKRKDFLNKIQTIDLSLESEDINNLFSQIDIRNENEIKI